MSVTLVCGPPQRVFVDAWNPGCRDASRSREMVLRFRICNALGWSGYKYWFGATGHPSPVPVVRRTYLQPQLQAKLANSGKLTPPRS